jgi:hypothetical protein
MSVKIKIDHLHLAVSQDKKVHAGVFAGEDKTKLLVHKNVHSEFLQCMVMRFAGTPEIITSETGQMYMVVVTEMKPATEEKKKIILENPNKELILPPSVQHLKKA